MLTIHDNTPPAALAQAKCHPLWKRQVELERSMLHATAERLIEACEETLSDTSRGRRTFSLGRHRSTWRSETPIFKPSVVPPKPWKDLSPGGYWTAYAAHPLFIPKFDGREQSKGCAVEIANYLQAIPWRVNKRVLVVVEEALKRNLSIAGLPRWEPHAKPPTPINAENNEDAIAQWQNDSSQMIVAEARRREHIRAIEATVSIAEEYASFELFYYPIKWIGDSPRPLVDLFEPSGSDLARALLEFADGLPITQGQNGVAAGGNSGDGWLAVHLSACCRPREADPDACIAWVFEREQEFRAIAQSPLDNLGWTKMREPWCALAAIFEFVDFLNAGYGFVSRLPVSVLGGPSERALLSPSSRPTARLAKDAGISLVCFGSAPWVTHAASAWRAIAVLQAGEAAERAKRVVERLRHVRRMRPDDPALAEFDLWERRSRGEFDDDYPIGSASPPL